MSGGSFDYLAFRDGETLLAGEGDVQDSLASMRAEIEKSAPGALRAMDTFLARLETSRARWRELVKAADASRELRALWHEIEWQVSGDGGDVEGAAAAVAGRRRPQVPGVLPSVTEAVAAVRDLGVDVGARAVADWLGIEVQATRIRLGRAQRAGLLVRRGWGLYGLPVNGEEV